MRTARRLPARLALALTLGALAAPAAAHAASVAYIEGGNIWLASPDGKVKAQLTTNGTPQEPWLGVAQSPTGITVGVYQGDPVGKDPRKQRLKVWDRNGIPVRDVPLASRATPTAPERPLSLEISDDGTLVADDYEYCVPGTTLGVPDTCAALARGTWLGSTTGAGGDAPDIPGARQPTFFGSRLVVSDGQRILTQPAPGGPGSLSAAPWIAPAAGLGYRRADVPPTGGKVAVEVFNGAVEAKNAIAVIPYSGDIGTGSADSSQGCTMGAPDVSGNAFAVAWSPDGSQIAWRDDAGLKVAGAPVLPWPSQAPCSLTAPPALITAKPAKAEEDLKDSGYRTTVGPSFGGADVAAVRAARAKTRGVGLLDPYKPIIALPRATRAKALRRGLPVTVTSAAAVPITVTARVGAGLADRLGIPTILATGTAKADHAGQQVTLKLRLTAKARRRLPKLAGSALTLQVVQAGRTSTRPLALG